MNQTRQKSCDTKLFRMGQKCITRFYEFIVGIFVQKNNLDASSRFRSMIIDLHKSS